MNNYLKHYFNGTEDTQNCLQISDESLKDIGIDVIYGGNAMTVVTKQNGEFVTLRETSKGMDIGFQFVP